MLGSLYLLRNFNNYFNRKVIKRDNLQDYLDFVGTNGYYYIEETNFNPNDGINTSHIVGDSANPFEPPEGVEEWSPDYALYVEDGIIKSKWFVLEYIRKREGQYQMILKRDTIVEKYNEIVNSPCYVEKGHLKDTDPMIVNNEGIQFNQIKTTEHYLKDETKVPWIVAYLNQNERPFKKITAEYHSYIIDDIASDEFADLRNFFQTKFGIDLINNTQTQKINRKIFNENSLVITQHLHYVEHPPLSPIWFTHYRNAWIKTSLTKTTYSFVKTGYQEGQCDVNDYGQNYIRNLVSVYGKPDGYTDDGWNTHPSGTPLKDVFANLFQNWINNWNDRTQPLMNAAGFTDRSSSWDDSIVKKYNGRKFQSNITGKIFTISINETPSQYSEINNSLTNSFGTSFDAVVDQNRDKWHKQIDTAQIQFANRTQQIDCNFIDTTINVSMNAAANIELDLLGTKQEEGHEKAFQTQKQPYDIICFPAFDTNITLSNGTKGIVSGNAGLNIARAISSQLGSDELYDVQLLPYCPVRELIGSDGDIDLRKAGARQYLEVKTSTEPSITVSFCIFATNPFQTFEIDKLGTSIESNDEVNVADILSIENKKIQSNTDMHRLSSPNYASSFEFNLAKCLAPSGSYPSMSKFKIDICYRPLNPYIHISPDFAFLYGKDFNDSRGLLCSGDFGLTTMKNAWSDFQIRNKNYQNIFDREIQHMETNRAIGREKEDWNVIKASVNAVASTALASAFGKGISGKIQGGIAGALYGGMNIASQVKEKGWNESAYQEERDFKIDMFSMQMDNIKALPNTITHSASFTNNFKFYPVLEYYTCTDNEKNALKNKILYNGMTVGRIDNIVNFISDEEERFVKGQMIRLDFVNEDSHFANDIYNEINRGLFFSPYIPIDKGGKVYGKK